jgi:glucose 1-dehydrogenase
MPEDAKPLAGRRALVTGGNTGIGRACCGRLAADGAAVAVLWFDAPEEADATLDDVRGHGVDAVAVKGDVGSEDDVQRCFAEAQEALGGPIDLLVNNAGIEMPHALVDMPLEHWDAVVRVNLTGPFLCSRELARRLPDDRPGVIVNMSSVHERIPWEKFSHYCATKGGLSMFAQTIAKELAPRGIRVVNVGPGAIVTPINADWTGDEAKRDAVLQQIPLHRLGQPEDVAAAVAWLASEQAGYVTGTTLFVDGGMTTYPHFT